MIDLRRRQRSFGDGLIAEQVDELWEDWMRAADTVLEDEVLLTTVWEALARRRPHSKTRGRPGTPADVVLRMLLWKHIRNWSFAVLVREVRAHLVYRQFTRLGAEKVPDDKTLGRLAPALGPEISDKIHQRLVALAQQNKVIRGRKMRVDTTVVETNIHYPTDSSLLGDGVRVLTRLMKQVTEIAGPVGTKLRDRGRSVQRRLIEIGRASRQQGNKGQEKLQELYGKLLRVTGRVVAQAKRFSAEIATGTKRSPEVMKQAALEGMRAELEVMLPRVEQVVRQTRARVFEGHTRVEGKLVSLFEPTTEIIRKGKASKPTEFGKLVKVQEAENQIIIAYEVYDQRPADSDLLAPSVEVQRRRLGKTPYLAAGDADFYSAGGERAVAARGVERVAVPHRSTQSERRKWEQKKRWFNNGQQWRTGSEGRISVVKRRHGLNRSRYQGDAGMRRWVGLGVIADNLINIGRVLAGST